MNGAGLNRLIWIDLLGFMENPVLTLDFPNRKSPGNLNARLAFDEYVNKAVNEVKARRPKNFIIVAHSISSLVGLKVAEKFGKELRGFVAISSVIPQSGQSFASSLPFPQKWVLPLLMSLFGTKPPKKVIITDLCNDLPPQKSLQIANEFTAESKYLYTTRITYDLPDMPRLYIKLTNDKTMPTDLQDQMAKNFEATKIETLASGHLPMLSKPKELARILSNFANTIK